MYKLTLYLSALFILFACHRNTGTFVIEDLGKNYELDSHKLIPGLYCDIPEENIHRGNTSIRNEDRNSLVWKGSPNSNGYGYFQRNRDLGQVFNVPEGKDVQLDALILRTSLGSNAVMEGAAGSEMTIVFYEVNLKNGESLRINENGTTKGELAKHGYDVQLNRCDDYIEGAEYTVIHRSVGGIFPDIPATTQPGRKESNDSPYGEQEGHLHYFRCDLQGSSELVLKAGKRYAFMIGFTNPGKNRGMALAIKTEVTTKESAQFVKDENGAICWGIRREGNGTLPPTMIQNSLPPRDSNQYNLLVNESMFPENHYETLSPTSNGYPDVDTYRTMQYYLELK